MSCVHCMLALSPSITGLDSVYCCLAEAVHYAISLKASNDERELVVASETRMVMVALSAKGAQVTNDDDCCLYYCHEGFDESGLA